jgi:glycosyltransferase involved in cell wall biosynthesis
MARELGLSKHVRFLGEFHDVPALLKRSDICVLTPSANEGLSNSILEYMAAGKPVVATDCGGNRELVAEGENGFVIPVGDTDALADRLTRLWHDRTLCNRMGEVGRIRIEQEFSRGKVLDQFAALYQGVAAACCER